MKKNQYKDYPTIATYSEFGGLAVKHIDYGIDTYLIIESGAYGFATKKTMHRLKVHHSRKHPYIIFSGTRVNTDEFIKEGAW